MFSSHYLNLRIAEIQLPLVLREATECSPQGFDFTGTEGRYPCSSIASLNNFIWSFMCYAVRIHLVFSDFLQVHFILPFFPGRKLRDFSFPQEAAQSRKREQPYQMEDTACLLCNKIDDLPLVELGFLRTVSNPVPKYFISSLICKILSRKTNIDIKPPKPQTYSNES